MIFNFGAESRQTACCMRNILFLKDQLYSAQDRMRTKIFVGRLPEACTAKDLEDLFGKYGSVTECDVVGKYGFVHMSKPEEADECIKKLNKYTFMGSQLSVEMSTSKIHPQPGTTGRARGPGKASKKSDKSRYYSGRDAYVPPLMNRNAMHPILPPRDNFGFSSYYPDDYRQNRDSQNEPDYYRYYYGRDRPRPYPTPYERRPPPYSMENPYLQRPYDWRPTMSSPVYSTRSPPRSLQNSSPPFYSSNLRFHEYWNKPVSNENYGALQLNRFEER